MKGSPVKPAEKTPTASILECIANLGPKPIRLEGHNPEDVYAFRREDLDRLVDLVAPKPTDSAAGVVNLYTDEITHRELMAEMEIVFEQFLEDFQYPVNRKGQPLDLRFLGPHIAYHLVRCGWRQIANRRMIKKQPIGAGPQRLDDAVIWVDINTPDDLDPDNMTVEQLKAAPPHIQAEAIRRLNGDPVKPADGRNPDLGKPGFEVWHQPWAIDAEGDPEMQEKMTRHAHWRKKKEQQQ